MSFVSVSLLISNADRDDPHPLLRSGTRCNGHMESVGSYLVSFIVVCCRYPCSSSRWWWFVCVALVCSVVCLVLSTGRRHDAPFVNGRTEAKEQCAA